MAYILNIETATTVCSVSLFNQNELLHCKEIDAGYSHAENLHVYMTEVLKESGKTFKDLDAIAVSKGPGSYTGLRIGASAAKGLAYALSIPLISVSTLKVMANAVLNHNDIGRYLCPMIDARRMEVYTCLYNQHLEEQVPVEAKIIDEKTIDTYKDFNSICFFGDGMPKCKELLSTLPNSQFAENIRPSSRFMGTLAHNKYQAKDFENTAYFEPFYLKDFIAGKKKNIG